MNARTMLNDAALDEMIAWRAGPNAPLDLAAQIVASVGATRQRRRPWWTRVQVPPSRTPAMQAAWAIMLIGLLVAAALSAALVGGELLRRVNELVVTPRNSAPMTWGPTTVTPSAFGPITWRTLDVPGSGWWWHVAGTPYGSIAVEDTQVLRWPVADGSWQQLALPDGDWRAFPVGSDVIVGGDAGDEAFWLHRSGSTWVIGEPLDLDGAMGVIDVYVGPRGIVLTDGTSIQYSTGDRTFVRAAQPPSKTKLQPTVATCALLGSSSGGVGEGHIGPMIVTDRGFIALTAADPADWNIDPVCEPVVWFSSDGSAWDLASTSSPFGPGAYVREVAGRAGRHVAIGGVPLSSDDSGNAVWVSDDGVAWERLSMPEPAGTCPWQEPVLCGHRYSRVVAGDAGWIILDGDGFAWTSTDGRIWHAAAGWPGSGAGWLPQELALSPGSIVEISLGERGVIGVFGP